MNPDLIKRRQDLLAERDVLDKRLLRLSAESRKLSEQYHRIDSLLGDVRVRLMVSCHGQRGKDER